MSIKACVFDAYGTLFDVAAAAREAAAEPGSGSLSTVWQKVAADWRAKQLQYTWLRAVADAHTDFWTVTKDGLDWALEASGLEDPELRERLLALYFQLSAYPEVPNTLSELRNSGFVTAILSNGEPRMLQGAVESAGITELLDGVLSAEEVGVFKPHRRVYELVGKHFGTQPDEVLFVSSNGWDAAHAAGFGFRSAWVNRAGEPMDRLPWKPEMVLPDLSDIPTIAGEE